MKAIEDARTVERLAPSQRGVFRLKDLENCLLEPHRAALYRRLDALIEAGVLRRFTGGTYVAAAFDLEVLCQSVAPDCAISFETVLARELVIGPAPAHSVSAVRSGRPATFEALGVRLCYHRLKDELRFGEHVHGGVRSTDAEKALLDVFTFHQRGRRALFDLYQDVDVERLDRGRLKRYLKRYANPRFVAFVRGALEL